VAYLVILPQGPRRPKRYRVEFRDPGGRHRSRTFRAKRDAERYLHETEASKAGGTWLDPKAGRIPLGDYAKDWLEDDVAGHVQPSTLRRYRSLFRTHIAPSLGEAFVNEIRPSHVRGLVASMTAKGLSPKTVRHVYTLLISIMRTAVEDGLIAKAPIPRKEGGKSILPAPTRPKLRRLEAGEVEALANAIVDPKYRALVYLGTYAAMRWGELAALRLGRLELLAVTEGKRTPKVHIVETPTGEPKWGSSGVVVIPLFVSEILAEHLGAFPPGDGGLIFTSPSGGPLAYPNFYRRVWVPTLEKLGWGTYRREKDGSRRFIPNLRIHDLRHTGVALSIQAGAHPRQIMELARHRNITMTLQQYGHVFDSMHVELAERLDVVGREAKARKERP